MSAVSHVQDIRWNEWGIFLWYQPSVFRQWLEWCPAGAHYLLGYGSNPSGEDELELFTRFTRWDFVLTRQGRERLEALQLRCEAGLRFINHKIATGYICNK